MVLRCTATLCSTEGASQPSGWKRQNSEEDLAGRSLGESNHLHKEYPMNCPYCASTVTKERTKQTALGYRMFRCSACKRTFNERTGTPFNSLESPTDIVLL